jgi:hypothetical protein
MKGAAVAAVNLSRVHPTLRKVAANLPKVSRGRGYEVRVTSGYRSYATQKKLYLDYINGRSLYPANPPGQSMHEKGLAIDVVSNNENDTVALLTSIGLVWAGPDDPIHFQMPGKTAGGGSRTQKYAPAQVVVTPAKKKKSTAKKILSAASWVPGPIGWGASILDFIF